MLRTYLTCWIGLGLWITPVSAQSEVPEPAGAGSEQSAPAETDGERPAGAAGAGSTSAAPGSEGAAPADPSGLDEILSRARELKKRPNLGEAVRGALEEAERAVARAREAELHKDARGAERAQRIARAALALAERRYAAEVERRLLRDATARRERSKAQLAAARGARAREAQRLRELAAPAAEGGTP